MSDDSIEVILVKLQRLEEMITCVHDEVRRTNGRVTALELEEARWQGEQAAKKPYVNVFFAVLGYSIAGAIGFYFFTK